MTYSYLWTIILLITFKIVSFDTLSQLHEYAQSHVEYPDSDSRNLLNPRYNSFYQTFVPAFSEKILMRLGLKEKPVWSILDLKKNLEQIVMLKERQLSTGRFIQKMVPVPGSHFIIWGDLHGAFHSLTRDLEELKRQQIINDSLHIIKENYYFVFNGNAINLSPYSLETLTIIIQLMLINGDRVIYIRGQQEDKEYWQNYNIIEELHIKSQGSSNELVYLTSLLERFFNTLPLALYLLSYSNNKTYVVRISYFDKNYTEINEQQLNDFFNPPYNSAFFNLKNKKSSTSSYIMSSLITHEERDTKYTPTKGLHSLEQDNKWMVMSSPIRVNRTLYEFFYDTFVDLEVKKSIYDWTLTLYNRDVRVPLSSWSFQKFKLVPSPQAQEQKTTESKLGTNAPATENSEEILVGSSMDLSRTFKVSNLEVETGTNLAFAKVNKEGGIGGKRIRFIMLDDEQDPQKARASVENLLKNYHVTMLLSPGESPSIQAYFDLIKDGKVLLLFPITGYPKLREASMKYVINFKPSYNAMHATIVRYIFDTLKAEKIAIFYVENEGAVGLADVIKKVLPAEKYLLLPSTLNNTNYSALVEKVKNYKPDALYLFASTSAATEFLRQLGSEFLSKRYILGVDMGEELFRDFLKSQGLSSRFVDVQTTPNPKGNLEIAKEYRAALGSKPIDASSFEGYLNASLLVELLKRIKGPLSKEKIIEAAEHIKNENFKGLQLDFNPKTRVLSKVIWLDEGKEDWTAIPLLRD